MKILFLCGLIVLFSTTVFAETAYRSVECPICGETYSEQYEYADEPYMPIAGFGSLYESTGMEFNFEQPCCPKCREKYRQQIKEKMQSVFDNLIEEIKDDNKDLKAINQEANKQKEIKELENQIKRLKGEMVEEEEYGNLTWDAKGITILSDTDTTIPFDADNVEGQDMDKLPSKCQEYKECMRLKKEHDAKPQLDWVDCGEPPEGCDD